VKVQGATYRKLPGRSIGFVGSRARLWLAEDHLLEVSGMFLAERYRRFPLADIRAFVVEKTRTQAIALWIYGGVFALCAGFGGLLFWYGTRSGTKPGEAVIAFLSVFGGFAVIVAVITFIGFLLTLLRGASCRCSIQTTAGLRVLAAPNRRRPTERMFAILAPAIEAAQAVRE